MRDVSMIAAGISIVAFIINVMQGDYLMALLSLGIVVLNVEIGVRLG